MTDELTLLEEPEVEDEVTEPEGNPEPEATSEPTRRIRYTRYTARDGRVVSPGTRLTLPEAVAEKIVSRGDAEYDTAD